jgi:PAS domain S-box-containing protein
MRNEMDSGHSLPDDERRFREMIDALPVAIYTTDAEGYITHFNPAASRFSGRTPELGTDRWCVSWKLYRPDGTPLPHDQCPMAVSLKEGREVHGPETILERPDGTRVCFVAYATLCRDDAGKILGSINMLVDVTDRKRREEAIARLAAIVESSDDAIVSKDLSGIITSWNHGAERLFGYTAQEVIGKPITILVPADLSDEEMGILERIRHGGRIDHYETVRRRKDGALLDISLTVSPIMDAQGTIVGASKIARDITDRKQAQELLQAADRRKNEFLATLAHELRNPLAPIRSSLDILRMTGRDDPANERVQEMMERQVKHMVRLVDDLLEVSRISTGKIDLRLEPTEIAPIVCTAIETSQPLIEAGGHQLVTTLPPEPLMVNGDRVRLSQVIANVLNNAAKYSEPRGQIWLTVSHDRGEVVVSVRDTGIGISADMLPHVFDMFAQADQAMRRSQEGLGIGLALVKRLVELHHGRVEARSDGEGRGSEFTIRLPLSQEPLPVVDEASPIIDHGRRSSFQRRILVVDDNQDAATSLGILLGILGSDVRIAHDGADALEAVPSFQPSLVLLDLGMPGMNGYEVARRIRELPQFQRATLVALTGWGQENDRRRTREAGFDHHLLKPVDREALEVLLADLDDSSIERR